MLKEWTGSTGVKWETETQWQFQCSMCKKKKIYVYIFMYIYWRVIVTQNKIKAKRFHELLTSRLLLLGTCAPVGNNGKRK